MNPTRLLRAAEYHRTPLIHFLGKRSPPSTHPSPLRHSPYHQAPLTPCPTESPDPTPQPHPASPSETLPDSFKAYRSKVQQHGPLGGQKSAPPPPSPNLMTYGVIGGHSGHQLGSIAPPKEVLFDRSELPKRFRGLGWTEVEIEAVETGGASLFG